MIVITESISTHGTRIKIDKISSNNKKMLYLKGNINKMKLN